MCVRASEVELDEVVPLDRLRDVAVLAEGDREVAYQIGDRDVLSRERTKEVAKKAARDESLVLGRSRITSSRPIGLFALSRSLALFGMHHPGHPGLEGGGQHYTFECRNSRDTTEFADRPGGSVGNPTRRAEMSLKLPIL